MSSFSPGSMPMRLERPILRQQMKVMMVQRMHIAVAGTARIAQTDPGRINQAEASTFRGLLMEYSASRFMEAIPGLLATAIHSPARRMKMQGYQRRRMAWPTGSRGMALGSL